MSKDYVICVDVLNRHDTLGLKRGTHYWRARTEKDGAYRAIRTVVIEPRDEEGNPCGDFQYLVTIDGRVVPFEEWNGKMIIGEEVDKATYETMLADGAWTQGNFGVRAGEKTDMRTLPLALFEPPGA